MPSDTIPPSPASVEGAVASQDKPDYCDPAITAAVEEAFEAVWSLIQASEPGDDNNDCGRRVELSQKLAALVVDGVTDPTELRNRVLASWPEGVRPTQGGGSEVTPT